MELVKLPQNVQAEQSLLGCILYDPNNLNEIQGDIKPQHFHVEAHKAILDVMQDMERREIAIDVVTLAEALNAKKKLESSGGITYLMQLKDSILSSDNIKHYARIVKEKASKRMLIETARAMERKAFDDTISTGDIIDAAEEKMLAISTNNFKKGFSSAECIGSTLSIIENNYKNGGGIVGQTTGFKSIDDFTSGLQKGDFVLIAARPSMGKTAFALNIAQYASKSSKIAIFSLEMSKEQLYQRLLSSRALIDFEKIKTGNLTEEEFVKLINSSTELEKRNLMVYEDAGISISEIKAICKKQKITRGLDVVFIDYLQLIGGDEKVANRTEEVGKISRTLKIMAKELDITVVALSQLSRAPEQRADHRPMMSDLRESGAIEQDADIIMFLYRDEYYNKESECKNIAEVIFAKNRNGNTGTTMLAWLGHYQRFAQLDCVGSSRVRN